ncbi:hypothetical protein JCM18382A_68030 [Bradyrhizobium sp. 17-4]
MFGGPLWGFGHSDLDNLAGLSNRYPDNKPELEANRHGSAEIGPASAARFGRSDVCSRPRRPPTLDNHSAGC